MLNHADLPDDVNTLKAMIAKRDELVQCLREQLTTHAVEIEHLKLLIAKLKRMQFGRKSEKLDRQIEQLELRLEDLQADATAVVKHDEGAEKPPRKKAPLKAMPDHLPRDEKVYLPAEQVCPACGSNLRKLGEDVAEQLEFVRASFKAIRHIRPKLACTCCDCIVQAPAPSRPIDRGLPGPALLAHTLVSKFVDHCVLRTQPAIAGRRTVVLY